jgi:hypothetical protein
LQDRFRLDIRVATDFSTKDISDTLKQQGKVIPGPEENSQISQKGKDKKNIKL